MSSSSSASTAPSLAPSLPPGALTPDNGLGTATYYGAVAVVVLVLLIITCVSRVMFRRRAARLMASRREQHRLREAEERNGMVRRGEEAGLPTYRQSAFELVTSAPFAAPPTAHVASRTDDAVAPPPYRPPPPKYDDDSGTESSPLHGDRQRTTSDDLGRGGQAVDSADVVEMVEMRHAPDSTTTTSSGIASMPSLSRQQTATSLHLDIAHEDVASYEQRTRHHLGPDVPDSTTRPGLEPPTDDSVLAAGRRRVGGLLSRVALPRITVTSHT